MAVNGEDGLFWHVTQTNPFVDTATLAMNALLEFGHYYKFVAAMVGPVFLFFARLTIGVCGQDADESQCWN